jgi:hypothetical protein
MPKNQQKPPAAHPVADVAKTYKRIYFSLINSIAMNTKQKNATCCLGNEDCCGGILQTGCC